MKAGVPNNAAVGFFCDQPEDYWIFAPIVRNLPGSEFIFPAPRTKRDRPAAIILQCLMRQAIKDGLAYRVFVPQIFSHKDAQRSLMERGVGWIPDFFGKYELIACCRADSFASDPAIAHKKKLLFCENALSWLGTPSFEKNAGLDGIAAPGQYFETMFSPFAPTAVIGSPRLEHLRNTHHTASKLRRPPQVLYAPSAFNIRWQETVIAVGKTVAPQYQLTILVPDFRYVDNTAWSEVDGLRRSKLVFRGEENPGRIIADADIVILEDFIPLLDCIFFEKPIILLDLYFGRFGWNPNEQIMPLLHTKGFGRKDPTSADIGFVAKYPESLPLAIKMASGAANTTTRALRKKLKNILISMPRGGALNASISFINKIKAGERPAESIFGRINEQQTAWARLKKEYELHFGAKPPYGPITKTLIRFLKRIEG